MRYEVSEEDCTFFDLMVPYRALDEVLEKVEEIVNREVEKERARLMEMVCQLCGEAMATACEANSCQEPSFGFYHDYPIVRAEYLRRNPEAA